MKRAKVIVVVAVMMSAVAAGERGRKTEYLLPTGEKVGVYRHSSLSGKPLFDLSSDDRLIVTGRERRAVKILDPLGRAGWVDGASVARAEKGVMRFDRYTEIFATFEEPISVFILDAHDPTETPIRLERSFSEELRGNIDRETAMRITDAQYAPMQIR